MGHKTLCEWRRHEIPADLKTLRKIVRKPKFVYGKCARSANDKDYLCQPLRLKHKEGRSLFSRRDSRKISEERGRLIY